MQLLEWQNLIFLLPIGLGALYLVLMALGAPSGGESGDTDVGGDADVSVEAGADFDHDADLDHGVEVGHGADLGHGVGADHEVPTAHTDLHLELHPSALAAFLGFLGIGKVPISILMMSYCFVWGAVGLAGVTVFGKDSIWTAIGVAAGAAVLVTRYLAAGISRLLPSVASYYTPERDLVGLKGEVLYEVTESSGMVRLCDERNNLHDVSCHVRPGVKSVPAGTTVVLLRYNAAARVFLVESDTGG
jgi:membrane protein implicated in regulation of membrane protease activity